MISPASLRQAVTSQMTNVEWMAGEIRESKRPAKDIQNTSGGEPPGEEAQEEQEIQI